MHKQAKYPFSTFDTIIEIITYVLLLSSWIYTIYYYTQLPETIAIHFDAHGNANGYGSKYTIWFAPVIFTALAFWLLKGAKNPVSFYRFSFKKYTEQETYVNYKTLLFGALLISAILTEIVRSMVVVSLSKENWGTQNILLYLGIYILIITYYYIKSRRK